MTLCEHCAGTFFPENIMEVQRYTMLRYERMEKPEAWHMTDALAHDLAAQFPTMHDLAAPTVSAVVLFGLPRCEAAVNRTQALLSADQTASSPLADTGHLC